MLGKFRDMTVKQAAPEQRNAPPSAPTVNEKYRGLAAKQQRAEATFDRVLGHVPLDLAGRVVQSAASDENFTPAERAGLDPEGRALQFHLREIQKAAELEDLHRRIDEMHERHKNMPPE